MTDPLLSSALAAYVGIAGRLDDRSPEERVVAAVGAEMALDLLPRLRSILDQMGAVDPPLWAVATEAEIARNARRWLHDHHPEVSDDAVSRVVNSFTFQWR